jgi:hypothetical protein
MAGVQYMILAFGNSPCRMLKDFNFSKGCSCYLQGYCLWEVSEAPYIEVALGSKCDLELSLDNNVIEEKW